MGSNAIQLAAAAGYEVITTSSPRNFEYVESLGASQVFDYNSPSVVPDIIAAFEGRTLAGAIAFGTTSADSCVRIVRACQKGNKFVSIGSPPVSFESLADDSHGRFELLRLTRRLVTSNVALQVRARRRGIRSKYIFGTTLKANEVSTAIYRDFLPDALAEGRYVAAPGDKSTGRSVERLWASPQWLCRFRWGPSSVGWECPWLNRWLSSAPGSGGMAIALKQAGIDDFVVLDRADDLGPDADLRPVPGGGEMAVTQPAGIAADPVVQLTTLPGWRQFARLPVTFVYAGIGLDRGALLAGPRGDQIAGRAHRPRPAAMGWAGLPGNGSRRLHRRR